MRNRKWWTYIVAVAAVLALAFFDKVSACGYIVALATGLFASNVAQKNEHFVTGGQQ